MTECNASHENRPKIHLSLNQVGVVILFNSGVIYQNQTCNVAYRQRCEEGILLLPSDPELAISAPFVVYVCPIADGLEKMEWYAIQGINEDRASKIDVLLQSHGFTKGISVDKSRLNESEEAWVYVNLEPLEYGLYEGFGSCNGVLVWGNSD